MIWKRDGLIKSPSLQMLPSDLLDHGHNNMSKTDCKNFFINIKCQPSFKMGQNELPQALNFPREDSLVPQLGCGMRCCWGSDAGHRGVLETKRCPTRHGSGVSQGT